MKNTHEIKGNVVKVTVPHKDGENFIFTIDLDDMPIVDSKASWSMDKNKTSAVANFREEGKMCKATMHRLLTGWKNVNFADEDRFNLIRTNMVEADLRKRIRKSGQNLKGNIYKTRHDCLEMIIEGKNPGIVLIDKEDFLLVSEYTWNINPIKGYVQTKTREGREGSTAIYLHRLIMGAKIGDPQVDHKYRDRLDNRKQNLRFATWSENQLNKGLPSNNTSGFRGVSETANHLFCAQLKIEDIRYRKHFKTFDEAKAQRLAWEKEYGVSPLE